MLYPTFSKRSLEMLIDQINYRSIVGKFLDSHLFQRRANARNVSTSLLLYGGITYFINSLDYPNLFNYRSVQQSTIPDKDN